MFLGLDVGTSSLKALLVDAGGQVLAAGSAAYAIDTPHPGWAEQDPQTWWQAAVAATRAALAGRDPRAVSAIGLSGQMHSLVLVDAKGRPLRSAILWADTRTRAEVASFARQVPHVLQREVLANPAATGFTALSLMWLKAHEPACYHVAHRLLLPKDYLRYRLTGDLATDASDASATLLFDVPKRRWAEAVVERLELSPALLPPLCASGAVAGTLTREAAKTLGLSANIPVVTGAGDQAAAAVGSGVTDAGPLLVTLGSGGQVFAALPTPTGDPALRVHLFCHALEDRWHLLGAVQNVGLALGWVRRLFGWSWARFFEEAKGAPAGADGLLFLPYLTGERTPHMDPAARGLWHGLTLTHSPAHLARAALEGVTFAVAEAVAACLAVGARADPIVLTGGGAKEPLRRQLLADTLGQPLFTTSVDDASARGAAVLAGAARGGLEATLAVEPSADASFYQERLARFRALHRAVRAAQTG